MSGIYDEFSGSLTAGVPNLNPEAIFEPDTLVVRMTRGGRRIADELRKAFGGFKRVVINVDGEEHEFSADSLICLLEGYESYGQVPEHGERENGRERESYGKRTRDSINDLMARKDGGKSNYKKLFGTPERAARTLADNCDDYNLCYGCSADCESHDCYDALLEWLRGEV